MMQVILDRQIAKAQAHEDNGGTVKVLNIGGVDVPACCDENGQIIEPFWRSIEQASRQNVSSEE